MLRYAGTQAHRHENGASDSGHRRAGLYSKYSTGTCKFIVHDVGKRPFPGRSV